MGVALPLASPAASLPPVTRSQVVPDWESWDIAGFGTDSWWTDVENGDKEPITDWEQISDYLEGAEQIVVSFLDDDGEAHYYTIDGYDWDYDAIEADFDDLEDAYGLD